MINIGGMIGMKIYYVRHGQTDLNLAQKMQGGGTEKELNETGISQAYSTKKELENVKYDLVICSPMKRAKQTAEIINQDRNVPTVVDERIRERRLGELEGHEITEEMEKKIWDYDLNYQIPSGIQMEILKYWMIYQQKLRFLMIWKKMKYVIIYQMNMVIAYLGLMLRRMMVSEEYLSKEQEADIRQNSVMKQLQ